MRSLREIAELFPLARDNGLTSPEVTLSREKFGANKLTAIPRDPIWKKFLEKFDEPIIKVLLAASLLKIVVDLFEANAWIGLVAFVAVLALVVSAWFSKLLQSWLPSSLFGLALFLVLLSVLIGNPSYEGLAVMLAVALATGVAFLSEYRSDREFEKLNADKDAIRVKVRRDNNVQTIGLEDVVVGDLVVLEMGDEIPADGRVNRATELMLDQSLMTGESEPVRKSPGNNDDALDGPDRHQYLYRGTQVVDGVGQMIVAHVGDDTMLGTLARKLSGEGRDDEHTSSNEERIEKKLTMSKAATPLQLKLLTLADLISRIGYVAAAAIFLALFIRGLSKEEIRFTPRQIVHLEQGEWKPSIDTETRKPITDLTGLDPSLYRLETTGQALLSSIRALLGYFVYMVIVIVVAVPEGLPMSVTISLALAMRKMTRANALVRQLVATETIGSATVICSDKTGTLTQNRMTVTQVALAGHVYDKTNLQAAYFDRSWSVPDHPLSALMLNSAINSTANLEQKEGKWVVVGNTTEGSLLQWLREGAWAPNPKSFDYIQEREKHAVIAQQHFSSERKRMTTVAEVEGCKFAFVKGAPETILAHCQTYLALDGSLKPISEILETVQEQLKLAARNAMRTLAFAQAKVTLDFDRDRFHTQMSELEGSLCFVGFVAIRDPLRNDVVQSIVECQQAGIEVKMITGDNIETALAIGVEAGLLKSADDMAMTSEEFNALDDDQLKSKLSRLKILARARPLDKYRMVKLLQEQGHVVAMTGDGTNDAPSLKLADVGLAMGIAGTEVAKEASKIILLDDSFGTIVRAVHWGRALYENIQRFVQFQLTINVSALAIAFIGPFIGLKPPFTVLQLLWINVIMDTFAAIALCSEPPRPGIMAAVPKRKTESILTRAMLGNIFVTAAYFVIVMLGLLIGMDSLGWFAGEGARSIEFPELTYRQITIFFTAYVFFQIWNQINCRSLSPKESGLARLLSNPQFLIIASLTVVGQFLIVTFGGEVFQVEPLTWMEWIAITIGTSSVLLFAEVTRSIRLTLAK